MATAVLPADLDALDDDDLYALVAALGEDPAGLEEVLAVLDTRDHADGCSGEWEEPPTYRDLVQLERLPGETLDQTVDRMYGDVTYLRYVAADEACCGRLLRREYEGSRDVHIEPYSLFHGPAGVAAKYASRELLDWFRVNGRLTWVEYKYLMLGRPGDRAAAARAARATQDYIR